MRRIPVAPSMDDPAAPESGDRTAGNLRRWRGEMGAVVGSLLGRRRQPAHENIVAGSEGTFDREVKAREGVEVGLHGSSGVLGPTKRRWILMGLANVAVVQQRGVAVDIPKIPRVKSLVHDSQRGSLPGAQGLAAIEGRPGGRDDVVQRGGVLEVRLERRHDDAGTQPPRQYGPKGGLVAGGVRVVGCPAFSKAPGPPKQPPPPPGPPPPEGG